MERGGVAGSMEDVVSLLLLVAGPVCDGCWSAEKGEEDGEGKWTGGSVWGLGGDWLKAEGFGQLRENEKE
ncbi:hypothetical protein NC652_011150 [Populus alba x Populus x berolinensis]|nr:hypothetical protein NC652_011150 [Populus alba x Populus x berolinensis]